MDTVEVKIDNLDFWEKTFGKLSKNLGSRKIIGQLAEKAIALIYKRTVSGKDVNNNSFKSYSKSYKEKKKKEGKTTNVDLQFSGQLLNSMTYKVLNNETARLYFRSFRRPVKMKNGSVQRAGNNIIVAENVQRTREFFGIDNNTDLKVVENDYSKYIDNVLKELQIS